MKIDEVLHDFFQHEIDSQNFREPNQKEIMCALKPQKTVREKKSWFIITLAAAVLSCFAFVFSWSFNNMLLRPFAKNITMKLPENPEEQVLLFWYSARSGMYSEK